MPANPPDNPRDPGRRGNREPYEGYVLSRYGGGGMFGLGGTMTGIDMPSIFLQGMRWKQMFQREGPRVMAAGHAIGGNIHDIRYASAANNLRNMYSGIDLSVQGIGGSVGDTIRQSVEQFKSYMDSVGGAEATGGATAMGLNALLSDLNAQRNNVTDAAQLHTIDVLSQKLAETIPLAMSEGLGGSNIKSKALGMFGEGYDAETTQQMDDALKQMVQSIRESADRIKGDHTLEQALRMKADALERAGERATTAEGKAKAMSVASFQIDRLQGITTSQKNAEEVRITARATKEGFITASQHLERRGGFLGGRGQALLMRGAGATFAKLGSVVAGLGQAGMILGSAYKGFKMFNDAANAHARRNMAADRERGQYGRMIRGTGMQTGDMLGAVRAGMTAGMDIKEVVGQMTSLQSELSHARFGEGQSITRLGKYGLSPFNVNGTTKTSNEVMIDMSRYLRSLKTDVERTQFLTDMNFKPEQMEYLLNYESEQKQFQARKRNPYMQTIFDRGAILDESGFHAKVDAASRRETKRIELENQEAELQGWWSGVMRQMNPENWLMKEYNIRQKGIQEAKSQMAMENLKKSLDKLAEIEKQRQKGGGKGAGGTPSDIQTTIEKAKAQTEQTKAANDIADAFAATHAASWSKFKNSDHYDAVVQAMEGGKWNLFGGSSASNGVENLRKAARTAKSEKEFAEQAKAMGVEGLTRGQVLNPAFSEKTYMGYSLFNIKKRAEELTGGVEVDVNKDVTNDALWKRDVGKASTQAEKREALARAFARQANPELYTKDMETAVGEVLDSDLLGQFGKSTELSRLGVWDNDTYQALVSQFESEGKNRTEAVNAAHKAMLADIGTRWNYKEYKVRKTNNQIKELSGANGYKAFQTFINNPDNAALKDQYTKLQSEAIGKGTNPLEAESAARNAVIAQLKKEAPANGGSGEGGTSTNDSAGGGSNTSGGAGSASTESNGGQNAEEEEETTEPLHPEEEWTPEEKESMRKIAAIGAAEEEKAAREARGLDANTEAELANIHRERQSGASSEDIQRRFGPKLMKLYNERYKQSLAIREGLQEGDEALGTQEANNRRWMEQNAANAQAVETMAAAGNAAGAAAASGLAHEVGSSTDDHHIESTVNVAGVNVTIQMNGSNLSPSEVAEQMGKNLAEVLKRELAQETYLVTNYQAVC